MKSAAIWLDSALQVHNPCYSKNKVLGGGRGEIKKRVRALWYLNQMNIYFEYKCLEKLKKKYRKINKKYTKCNTKKLIFIYKYLQRLTVWFTMSINCFYDSSISINLTRPSGNRFLSMAQSFPSDNFQSKLFKLVGNLSWRNSTIRIKSFRNKMTTVLVILESKLATFVRKDLSKLDEKSRPTLLYRHNSNYV